MKAVFSTAAILAMPVAIIAIALVPASIHPSYAHGVAICMSSSFFRMDNQYIQPDHIVVGDTVKITTELKSMINREITIKSGFSVIDQDKLRMVMNDSEYFSKCNPPPPVSSLSNITTTDFQVVNSSQTKQFTLEPGVAMPYEIELKSVRPGVFHLSPGLLYTIVGANYNETIQFGRGMTVNVYRDEEATSEPQTYSLKIGNSSYSFNYTMYGARRIEQVSADPDMNTLSMVLASGQEQRVGAAREGIIEVTLPKTLLDATFGPHQFLPFVDGEKPEYETLYSSCDKVVMRIHFYQDAQKIAFVRSDIFQLVQDGYSPKSFVVQPQVMAPNNNTYVLPTDTDASNCVYTMYGDQNKLHVDLNPTREKQQGYFSVLIRDWMLHGNYTIYVDGQPAKYSDQVMPDLDSYDKTLNLHYLTIDYPRGAKSIDIVGTSIIPEFGSTAILMIVASVPIMVVLAMQRFKYFKRK